MKLRFPIYFTISALLSYLSDAYIIKWVPDLTLKSTIYGLLIGLSFLLLEKSKITVKQIPVPVGIGIIGLGLAIIIFQNHFSSVNPFT